MNQGERVVRGCLWDDSSALHLLCTLLLITSDPPQTLDPASWGPLIYGIQVCQHYLNNIPFCSPAIPF